MNSDFDAKKADFQLQKDFVWKFDPGCCSFGAEMLLSTIPWVLLSSRHFEYVFNDILIPEYGLGDAICRRRGPYSLR